MVETASIKGKIISFHSDSTSLCGLRRKNLSEQTLLKIVNDPAKEVKSWEKGRVRGPFGRAMVIEGQDHKRLDSHDRVRSKAREGTRTVMKKEF